MNDNPEELYQLGLKMYDENKLAGAELYFKKALEINGFNEDQLRHHERISLKTALEVFDQWSRGVGLSVKEATMPL